MMKIHYGRRQLLSDSDLTEKPIGQSVIGLGSKIASFLEPQATFGYTQPVGFGRPAILQAPLPGPDGNSS